jgi:thiamine transport system permease protein
LASLFFEISTTFIKSLGLTFLADPVYWIVAAHVFVNYSIAVRTIGGVWASLDQDVDSAAELDGAGRLRTAISISLPQLRPAIFSAASLVFLFSATSFGIVLVLGGGQVQTIETLIFFAATQRLDLELAGSSGSNSNPHYSNSLLGWVLVG